MIELSSRQHLIIKLLGEYSKPIHGSELSKLLHISPRTLRYEIKNINGIFGINLITSDKNGYYLNRTAHAQQMLTSLKINDTEEVTKMIILALLENNDMSISDLAEEHYFSDSTIYNIIKKLQPRLHEFGLRIIRHDENLKLMGTEYDKRRLLAHFFLSEANSLATSVNNFNEYFTKFEISDIQDIVKTVLAEHEVYVEDIYLKNIVISTSICLQRVIDGYHSDDVPTSTFAEDNIMQQEITKEICDRICSKFNLQIQSSDFQNILVFITGSLKVTSNSETSIFHDKKFKSKILEILLKTSRKYQIDLGNDEFVDSFVLHVHFLILRAQNASFFFNDISSSLRHSHPFIYEVAVYMAHLIEREFNAKISDDEIGLLAIYLGTIATFIQTYQRPKVACVCPSYHELKKLMTKQLVDVFGSKFDIVKVVSTYEEIDIDDIDLIISSVPTPHNLANVIQVSPILTPIEIRKLEKFSLSFSKKQKQVYFREHLLSFFDESLFYYNHGLSTGTEILDFFNQELLKKNVIDNKFMNDVMERENLSSTAFFGKFALPHSLSELAKKTKVVYYYNEKPINWFGHYINLVILPATSGYSSQTADVYNLLFDILIDDTLYKKLIQCKTMNELIKFVEQSY